MLFGIIGAIIMTVFSLLWLCLPIVIPENRMWMVHIVHLGGNAVSGFIIGLLIYRLQKVSATDSLTQVYNRGYFMPQLEKHLALAKRYSACLSIVLIDLDKFKEYNDAFGHPYGDRILREVALNLQSLVRTTDIVARYGGDEFVVLLPHTDTNGAITLMQRVKGEISKQVLQRTSITFSTGVASYPADGDTTESLMLRADQALYAAKNQRGSIRPYDANLCPAAENR